MSQFKTLILTALFAFPQILWAQSSGKGGSSGSSGSGEIWNRANSRESKRWTLQEWMEQKDRNRMMDIWLQLNSPSPYELLLGVWQNAYKTDTTNPASNQSYTSLEGQFSAYAQIFGLTCQYENNTQEHYNDLNGMFDLRLAGNSVQNSNLTLHLGQRTRNITSSNPSPSIKNNFGELSLTLHMSKYFGVEGSYRLYQPTTDTTLNQTIGGNLTEGGAFIDFKALRIFGRWYQDIQTNSDPTTGTLSNTTTRTGIRSGVVVYF